MYHSINTYYTKLKTSKQKPKYRWRQFAFKAASRCWKHWKRSESKETARNPKIQEIMRNQKGYNRNRNDQESCLKTAEVPFTSGPSPLQHRRFDYRKCHSPAWILTIIVIVVVIPCWFLPVLPRSTPTVLQNHRQKRFASPHNPRPKHLGAIAENIIWNLIFIFHHIIIDIY